MPDQEGRKDEVRLAPVTLDTIAGGAVVELFEREFARVLADVEDPNTVPDAKRTLTIEITLKPTENREASAVGVKVRSKLAGVKPVVSMVHLTTRDGRPVAVGANPNQIDAFSGPTGVVTKKG